MILKLLNQERVTIKVDDKSDLFITNNGEQIHVVRISGDTIGEEMFFDINK
jgi:hypothetical protein